MNPSDLNRPCRWALMKLGAWLGGGESTRATGAITVQGHPELNIKTLPILLSALSERACSDQV